LYTVFSDSDAVVLPRECGRWYASQYARLRAGPGPRRALQM